MVEYTLSQIKRGLRLITDFLPTNILLRSNVTISAAELEQALAATAIEREWYARAAEYQSIEEILADLSRGILVKVVPAANYAPILRFRNPELVATYPPFLTAEAKELLDRLTAIWRHKADAAGIDRGAKLSLSSLVRTHEYQQALIRQGKIAQPHSPHLRGEAFDIDLTGYYHNDVAVNPRTPAERSAYAAAFAQMGAKVDSVPAADEAAVYNPRVHELLKEALEELQQEGQLHYLEEYAGTAFACLHVCRNPNYRPK